MVPQIKATAFFHLIEWIMFLILLVTAGFLAQQVLHEYQEGKTNFGISTKPLTVHDVPTLTICFIGARTIAYEEDILITAFEHYTENTRQLKEGKNDHHSHNITLEKLVLSPIWNNTSCFTLNFDFMEDVFHTKINNTSIWDRIFHFDLLKIHLLKQNKEARTSQIKIFITSKENSFGAVIYQWFDGKFPFFQLQRERFYFFHITKTRQYEHVPESCSRYSFFECVAYNLKFLKRCQEDGNICTPISLPSTKEVIVFCASNKTQCWEDVKKEVFPLCMAKKSCTVQEYDYISAKKFYLDHENDKLSGKQEISGWGGNDEVVQNMFQHLNESLLLALSFDDLDCSNGDGTNELEVEVWKEYYIMSGFSLVGNLGGQMGLFIGFSFLGCFSWLLSRIQSFWSQISIK